MNKDRIKDLFLRDAGCAQIAAAEFTEETGKSVEELYRMAACFDGGMLRGETCGAVIAAYMIIGLLEGHDGPDQLEQKGKALTLEFKFNEIYQARRNSYICREIMGADISTPEGMEQIIQGGLMMDICPGVIEDVVDSLKQAIKEVEAEDAERAENE